MTPLYRLGALFSIVAALTVTRAATAQDSASIAHDATSHAHDTVYYTHDWDSTGHDHAYYMQVRTKYGDGWTIANQTTAGLPVHTFTMVNDTRAVVGYFTAGVCSLLFTFRVWESAALAARFRSKT